MAERRTLGLRALRTFAPDMIAPTHQPTISLCENAPALALAKLYRAANRDADAHAVLAPAVEGFLPTQQFPELAEAQTLLAALSP